MRHVILGLGFEKQCGKDTLASIFNERHGYHVMSFAYALKKGVRAMFDLTHAHTDGVLKEEVIPHLGVSARQLLQHVGTEGVRGLDPTIWAKAGMQRAREWIDDYPEARIVFTDVRFPQEAEAIREMGGKVVRIRRPGYSYDLGVPLPGEAGRLLDEHPSETAMRGFQWDMTVDNDGSLYDLEAKADSLFKVLEIAVRRSA